MVKRGVRLGTRPPGASNPSSRSCVSRAILTVDTDGIGVAVRVAWWQFSLLK